MGLLTFLPATRTTTTTTFSTAGSAKHKHPKTRQQQQQQQPQPPPPPSKTRKKQDHNNKRDDHRNRHKTPPKQSSKPVIQNPNPKPKLKQKQQQQQEQEKQQQQYSSWDQFKNLLTCKQIDQQGVHDPSKIHSSSNKLGEGGGGNRSSSSCGSMCSFRDVVHGNTRVVDRADSSSHSPESSSLSRHRDQADETRSLVGRRGGGGHGSSSGRSFSGASVRSAAAGAGDNNGRHPSSAAGVRHSRGMGMPLGKFSGCYECRMIVDPSRYPIIPRTMASTCSQCGEIFPKIESLEHHQAVRHAVSELGAEDSGRNIVEIIFKSSWLKKDDPICKIERILKVHNTQRTIQRFEDCRDAVKLRANNNTKKNPRCAADGNELLRFHCTTLSCALGARGSSSLCGSVPGCGVCTIIRHGFQGNNKGVTTTASSGRAHDSLSECADGRKAMLVCRVIAGRVRRINNTINEPASTAMEEDDEVDGGRGNLFSSADNAAAVAGAPYDSVAGSAGIYSNLEELVVFNPKAILPCFVVIYKTMNIGAS